MRKRSLFVILIVAAFLGGAIGTAVVSRSVEASIFSDFLNLFRGGSGTGTPTEIPATTGDVPLYKPVIDYENAVVAAVEGSAPSVVSIVISKDVPIIERCPYDPFGDLPSDFEQYFDGFGGFTQPCQTGTKRQEVGGGSGFIVSEDGLIVTNKHVVSDADADYTVFLNDGKKYDAKVIARDSYQDVALIRITAPNLKPVVLGDSDSVKLGQTAIAIGNALGEFRNTVSVGVISGLARTITASGAQLGTETLQGVIQTDAAINPGNSGGPLLNLKGEVIGINTAVASGAENIGFTIPINQAKRAIESVKKTGSIQTPYLGVRFTMVTEEIAKAQKLSVTAGALVRGTADGPGVLPNSPAAKAGIQAEDIITRVGDDVLSETLTLSAAIQKHSVGDTVSVTVQRGEQTLTLDVTLEERPAASQQ
jgi:serine protease Do